MFSKILIANRGEIACRIAATARRLGVRTVAVFSDADARARHVAACDEAWHLGAAPPRDSYLRIDRLIEVARASGAEAVHPGYGFLSENEAFARACAEAGRVFIGPPPAAIAAMGSKSAAKALMADAGVPLVPGYHGERNEADFLLAQAVAIGFPVLIKASAGGGGKGMRRVDRAEDFSAALAACQREAQASFGDARVLVERYVTRPRHIEIQVFADRLGQVVHLFERDCSVQRRHQKVLEEAPAPGLSADCRARMGAAAVAAARAVGYQGAGTVEFIAEPAAPGADPGDLRFYFMEMNTRLQVEHPVTEAITGLDLVEWQLRVAAGEALPRAQAELRVHGHAIEARVCAENPQSDFLPATGRLLAAHWPPHVAFRHDPELPRVDTGFGSGDEISPHYDSMIAKLIVWGADRSQALARLQAALAATQLVGLQHNTEFLRRIVGSAAFRTADLDTALIERERAAWSGVGDLDLVWVAGGVLAHDLAEPAPDDSAAPRDPWSSRDGWRQHGAACRCLELEWAGQRHTVRLWTRAGGGQELAVGDQCQPWSAQALGGGRHAVRWGDRQLPLQVHAHGDRLVVQGAEGRSTVRRVTAATPSDVADAGRLTAPMPGRLVAWLVRAGDTVQRGQPLAVLEAMKMEHTLLAPSDGCVRELRYGVGDPVAEAEALLVFEPLS